MAKSDECIVLLQADVECGFDKMKSQDSHHDFQKNEPGSSHLRSKCDVKENSNVQRELLSRMQTGRDYRYPLAEAKEFHFFVSYSSEDSSRVLPIINELEKTYGVRCMVDNREFTAGQQIHTNIETNMQKSMKVLLFVSPQFTQSSYCKYESSLAFVMSMENKDNCIIPLRLDDCTMPGELKTLIYIDFDTENLVEKIMEAYTKTESGVLQMDQSSKNKFENGYSVILPIKEEQGWARFCVCRPMESHVVLDAESKQAMRAAKMKVTEKSVSEAVEIVNVFKRNRRFQRRPFQVNFCIACCLCPIVLSIMSMVWGIIGFTVYDRTFSKKTADTQARYEAAFWPVVISTPILICVVLPCFYYHKHKKDIKRLSNQLFEEYTTKTYSAGVIYRLHGNDVDMTLEIVRYDIKPCQRFLANILKQKHEENTNMLDQDISKDFDFEAEYLIRRHLHILVNGDFPDAPEIRHPVKGGKSCICQIIETRQKLS